MGPLKSVCILSVECVLQVIPEVSVRRANLDFEWRRYRRIEPSSRARFAEQVKVLSSPLLSSLTAYRRREVRPGKMVRIFSLIEVIPTSCARRWRSAAADARRTAIPSFRPLGLYGLIDHACTESALTPSPPLATQVNIPKAKKGFCKKCKKHTPHKVTQYKTGKASLYAQGEYREREKTTNDVSAGVQRDRGGDGARRDARRHLTRARDPWTHPRCAPARSSGPPSPRASSSPRRPPCARPSLLGLNERLAGGGIVFFAPLSHPSRIFCSPTLHLPLSFRRQASLRPQAEWFRRSDQARLHKRRRPKKIVLRLQCNVCRRCACSPSSAASLVGGDKKGKGGLYQ